MLLPKHKVSLCVLWGSDIRTPSQLGETHCGGVLLSNYSTTPMSKTYTAVPKSETTSRATRLQSLLRSEGLDGALLMSVTELYYYSGIGTPGVVYVPADGEPVCLSERNLDLVKTYSPLTDIRPLGRLSMLFDTLNVDSTSQVAIEGDVMPFSLVTFLQSKAEETRLVDGSNLLRQIRSVKSDFEIDLMERAATLVDESFEYCTEIAAPDMTEIDFGLEDEVLEKNIRKLAS